MIKANEFKRYSVGGTFANAFVLLLILCLFRPSNVNAQHACDEAKQRTNAVFLTEFKIGGAPSNTLEVFLIAKGSHLGESDLTLTAAGISKYFGTSETGLFVTGGVGLSDVEFAEGLGLFGGVGYEFSKHFSISP